MADINRYNRCLPYSEDLLVPDISIADIIESLNEQLKLADLPFEQAKEKRSKLSLKVILVQLGRALELKYPVSDAQYVSLVQLLAAHSLSEKNPVVTQIKVFNTLSSLISKFKRKKPHIGGKEVNLEWKDFYKILIECHLPNEAHIDPPRSSIVLDNANRASFVQLLLKIRHYFRPGTAEEILQEFSPKPSEWSNVSIFRNLGILVNFLPTAISSDIYDAYLPQWMELWHTVDNCRQWDFLLLILCSRARKYSKTFDWAEVLPSIVTRALASFSLPTSYGSPPENRDFPSSLRFLVPVTAAGAIRRLAKLLIFLAPYGEQKSISVPLHLPSGMDYTTGQMQEVTCTVSSGTAAIIKLFSSIRTYFHPSNTGKWSEELTILMNCLMVELCKALGWKVAADQVKVDAYKGKFSNWPKLPPGDVDALLRACLPIAHQALYSKSSSVTMYAEQCLKNIACISPSLLASSTIPLLCQALDPSSVNMTHQAPVALRALGSLTQALLYPRPILLPSLPILLEWSLPGIDPNDPPKTAATLSFYISILSWIPVRNDFSSLSPGNPFPAKRTLAIEHEMAMDIAFDEENAWAAIQSVGPAMMDWSLGFLDRIFVLLQTKEAPHKFSDGVLKQAMNKASSGLSLLMRRVLRLFFSRMESATLQTFRGKVLAFVTGSTLPEAAKDASYLLEAVVCAQPVEGLRDAVAALTKNISFAGGHARTTAWRLRLLAGAVRSSGDAVINHLETLKPLIAGSLEDDDKVLRKSGGKLLRRCLQALTEIYPVGEPLPNKWLGQPVPYEDLKIEWNMPTSAGLAEAKLLLDAFLFGNLSLLKGEETSGGEEKWKRKLKVILNAVRGATAVMYDLEGGDDAATITGGKIVTSRLGPELNQYFVGLRRRIANELHDVLGSITGGVKKLGLERDTKSFKYWIRIASELLCVRSFLAGAAGQYTSMNSICKSFSRDWISKSYGRSVNYLTSLGGPAPASGPGKYTLKYNTPPRMMQDQIYLQHLKRVQQASFSVPKKLKETPECGPFTQLFQDLIDLSAYNISTVRVEAQDAVEWASSRWGWLLRSHLQSLTSYLTASKSEDLEPHIVHERAVAATHILRQNASIRQIASRWDLYIGFVRALVTSYTMLAKLPVDKVETMSKRIHMVSGKVFGSWHLIDVESKSRREQYNELVEFLLDLVWPRGADGLRAPGVRGSLHWRYELLVSWNLLLSLRHDLPIHLDVWRWFLRALQTTEGQPLQKLALGGLSKLLALRLVEVENMEGKENLFGQMASEGDFVLVEEPADSCSTLPSTDIARTLLDPAFLKTLVIALAHNHAEADEALSGGLRKRSQWSVGVEELLQESFRNRHLRYPLTRLALSSNTFDVKHSGFVKTLIRLVGPQFVRPLLVAAESILVGMATEYEKAYYACVAEVVAGVIRACTEDDVSPAIQKDMWAQVLPLMERILPKLSLEYALAWNDSFRFACTNRQLAVMEPLVVGLLGKVESTMGNGSGLDGRRDDYTSQAKWLRLLQMALIELLGYEASRDKGWIVAGRLIPLLFNALGNPYKVVREEVGRTLYIIFGFGGMPLSGPLVGALDVLEHTQNLVTADVDAEVSATTGSLSLVTVTDQESSGIGGTDPVVIATGDSPTDNARQDLVRKRETVLFWLHSTLQGADAVRYAPFLIPLLPVAFEASRDRDVDLAALGKHLVRLISQGVWLKARGSEDDSLSRLLKETSKMAEHKSWYVKQEVGPSLAILQAHHTFLLRPEESIDLVKKLMSLLGDERKEVQEKARTALTSVLSSMDLKDSKALAEKSMKLAHSSMSVKRKKAGAKGSTTDTSAAVETTEAQKQPLKTQQTNVYALCALVLAFPYEVPEVIPPVLALLARFMNGPLAIVEVIRQTFTNFKRTHQDEWEVNHRLKFTQEQLDAFSEVLISPHYYA